MGKTVVSNSLDKTTVRVACMFMKCDQLSNRSRNFIGANKVKWKWIVCSTWMNKTI